MTKQQYSFRPVAESLCDDAWSSWRPLEEGHLFDEFCEYRFRPTTVALPDGVYAKLDDDGLPISRILLRKDGLWSYAAGDSWMSNLNVEDRDIRDSKLVRLTRHPAVD